MSDTPKKPEDSEVGTVSDTNPSTDVQRLDLLGRKQPALPSPTPQQRLDKRLTPRRQRLALDVARLHLTGNTAGEIATKLRVHERTIQRLRRHPDYAQAIARARAAIRRETEEGGEVARLEAIEANRLVLRAYNAGDKDVSASDAVKASSAVLAATAPTSQAQQQRARKELLSSLSPKVRQLVVEDLQSRDSQYLDGLTIEELEALLLVD